MGDKFDIGAALKGRPVSGTDVSVVDPKTVARISELISESKQDEAIAELAQTVGTLSQIVADLTQTVAGLQQQLAQTQQQVTALESKTSPHDETHASIALTLAQLTHIVNNQLAPAFHQHTEYANAPHDHSGYASAFHTH